MIQARNAIYLVAGLIAGLYLGATSDAMRKAIDDARAQRATVDTENESPSTGSPEE